MKQMVLRSTKKIPGWLARIVIIVANADLCAQCRSRSDSRVLVSPDGLINVYRNVMRRDETRVDETCSNSIAVLHNSGASAPAMHQL